MNVGIGSWAAWVNGVVYHDINQSLNIESEIVPEQALPVPAFVPPMQRRRLSKLARLTLSQIEKIPNFSALQSVFCSRHGDLPKTSELVIDVANKEELSPTQFALSVHNAISGQFGIFTKNRQPSTLISAGRDSFHLGLIDAVVKLNNSDDTSIMYVYSDMPTPAIYQQYNDEKQFTHCIVLELSKRPNMTFDVTLNANDPNEVVPKELPQSVAFLNYFLSQEKQISISGNHHWDWIRK